MAVKDITEKALEWMPDIFADIVNAYFAIKGIQRRVNPGDLVDTKGRSVYVSSGDLRDQERDVVKLWVPAGAVLALVGFENQTEIDNDMPLRVPGYQGGDYRYQLTQKGPRYPVISIVLYFGTERRWTAARTLYERLNVPDDLKAVVDDVHVHVFELAFLTEEQERLFKSDFKHVVHYLRQVRMKQELKMLPDPLDHAPELLTLLKALAKDDRYDELIRQAKIKQERGETMTLPSLVEDAENRGIAIGESRGIAIGERRGIAIGESRGRAEEREAIRERLIAGGISPADAARYTGLSI